MVVALSKYFKLSLCTIGTSNEVAQISFQPNPSNFNFLEIACLDNQGPDMSSPNGPAE